MRKLKLHELGRISVEEFKEAEKFPVVVVLDNIRSMHNVGSVFRSADAFRIEKIYLCGYTPQPPHRDIRKVAIGAEESVDWEYSRDIDRVVKRLQDEGWTLIAVEQTDASVALDEFKFSKDGKYALVFGNEVEGVRQKVVDACAAAIEIPQYGTKHSLNISVAVGVVLFAAVRGMR